MIYKIVIVGGTGGAFKSEFPDDVLPDEVVEAMELDVRRGNTVILTDDLNAIARLELGEIEDEPELVSS